MDNTLMDTLKELDKEYGGFSNIQDGVYAVELGANTKRVDNNPDRFRLGWKVVWGEYKGREIGDFVGWFGPDDHITKINRGVFTQCIKALSLVADEEQRQSLATMVGTLRALSVPSAENKRAAVDAIETCFKSLIGIRLNVTVFTNKKGYQNPHYLNKGNLIDAPSGIAAESVSV